MSEIQTNMAARPPHLQPLLKWPGGKRWLFKQVEPHLPESFSRYIEPFAGGAALFFALRPPIAILADINADLIKTYKAVSADPEGVLAALAKLTNSREDYYRIRDFEPASDLDRAVRMLYLMRLSFNGIYRVNLHGTFNVPYGQKTWMPVCNPTHLRACANALRNAELMARGYGETLALAGRGDLVYVDPPYTVAHNNNGFLKYNEKIFSWQDQKDLAKGAREAADRGAHVLVSNADHSDLHELYDGFQRVIIRRYTSVSGTGAGRRHVTESLYIRGHP